MSRHAAPPRERDGPLPALATLIERYGESARGAPPAVLVLGDSVLERVSRDDADDTTLAEHLERELAEAGGACAVSWTGYHPGLFAALLAALRRLPRRPAAVVLPVNLRCFSPQWAANPEWRFDADEAALREWPGGGEAPRVAVRPVDEEARRRFRETLVTSPLHPLATAGAFLDAIHAPAGSGGGGGAAERSRALFAFHYGVELREGHERLAALAEAVSTAAALGLRAGVYLTPINRGAGGRHLGDGFHRVVGANARLVRRTVERAAHDAGSRAAFADWTALLPSERFFHADSATEHLDAEGRRALLARLAPFARSLAGAG